MPKDLSVNLLLLLKSMNFNFNFLLTYASCIMLVSRNYRIYSYRVSMSLLLPL